MIAHADHPSCIPNINPVKSFAYNVACIGNDTPPRCPDRRNDRYCAMHPCAISRVAAITTAWERDLEAALVRTPVRISATGIPVRRVHPHIA